MPDDELSEPVLRKRIHSRAWKKEMLACDANGVKGKARKKKLSKREAKKKQKEREAKIAAGLDVTSTDED